MTSVRIADPVPRGLGGPSVVLLVGGNDAAHLAAARLQRSGVKTVLASTGSEAVARLADQTPDLLILGEEAAPELDFAQVLRYVRDASAAAPPLVMIGEPESEPMIDDLPRDAEYLPADVGVAELVHHVRSRLNRTPARIRHPSRAPISEDRMLEEIDREFERAELAGRPGALAIVNVAELTRLEVHLGSDTEFAVAAVYDELLALDAEPLERHSPAPGGGIYVLMPEVSAATANERLQRLSSRIAGVRLDFAGEHLRLTPVIGYTTFSAAPSGRALREQVSLAGDDAGLHLDLLPVRFTAALAAAAVTPARDRLLLLAERLRSPLQVGFTFALLLSLPFIVYVCSWYAGFDLTKVTYPLVAAALAVTAMALWIESFRAMGAVAVPPVAEGPLPRATAIIVAYLPNEAATIVDTVTNLLLQDYRGDLEVILAYNTPRHLPIEDTLAQVAADDPRLLLLRVAGSTSKAQNINAALAHANGEFVGIFDADHHPAQGSFLRAWRWLSNGHDIVQGHCVVRNGDVSWVARMVAVEFETIYAVSHPGRARLHGFGIFGGSNGYWRRDALRQIRMQRTMLTEDIDSSMRSLREGFSIVSDPNLVSSELAPTTLGALWNQRLRWAQGWTQTSRRHLAPALTSDLLGTRQKLGAAFLLGWAQLMPWITIQVIPILGFVAWQHGGLGRLDWLIPLFVLLTLFTFSVGAAQAIFAYILGDETIRRHRGWFVVYGLHSIIWFGEFKNLIVRVAQLKEVIGERQWRVTPRTTSQTLIQTVGGSSGDEE